MIIIYKSSRRKTDNFTQNREGIFLKHLYFFGKNCETLWNSRIFVAIEVNNSIYDWLSYLEIRQMHRNAPKAGKKN